MSAGMTDPSSPNVEQITGRAHRQIFWPVLLTAVITWESVSAVPGVGPAWLSFDKLAHFGVFGLLATTIARIDGADRWPVIGELWAIVLVSIYGLGTELLQSLTPMRSMEYNDWLADTSGAAVAVIVYLRWTWYRHLLELPVNRRRARASQQTGGQGLPGGRAADADPQADRG